LDTKLRNDETKSDIALEDGIKSPSFSLFGLILLVLVIFISSARLRESHVELIYLQRDEEGYIEAYLRQDIDCWNEIVRYARNLSRFFIHHRGFDGQPQIEAVTWDEMAEDMAQLTGALTFELTEALSNFNRTLLDPQQPQSAENEAARELSEIARTLGSSYIADFEYQRQIRLRERVANFVAVGNYLENTQEFVYFLHDSVLEQTFTNIPYPDEEFFLANNVYVIIDLSTIPDTFNGIPLHEDFARAGISGLIALPIAQPPESVVDIAIHRAYISWMESIEYARTQVNIYIGITLAAAIITTIIVVKVLLPNLQGVGEGFNLGIGLYLKIPLIIKMILSIYAFWGVFNFFDRQGLEPSFLHLPFVYIGIIIVIFTIVILIRLFRGRYIFSDELEVRTFSQIITGLKIIRRLSPVLLPMISIGLMGLSLGFMIAGLYIMLVLAQWGSVLYFQYILMSVGAFGLSAAVIISLLVFTNYAKSYYYIRIIAEGSPVSIPAQKGFLHEPLNILNGLSVGLQESLEEQLHAERTKTELITNVSHDLKTPLTSIINYVDLLKKSNIEDAAAKEYVEILESKSERLKILIEDLFEAAKLTSRSMELNVEPVDIVQLLTQAIGELSEKFESKNIEIRFKAPDPPEDKLIIILDGQRMWRVFENLLNNMANYAPQGSRAYINIEISEGFVEIIMKNVSLYPLDFDPVELFERFKRGDAARTTEGSGLGLSIARDIVELHGGKVEITIDGDLFKVTITLGIS